MAKLIPLLFLVLGCTSADGGDDDGIDPPRCGDLVCDGGETTSTCPSDCPAPACATSPDNCTGETICIASRCEAAFPRVYRLTGLSVSVPTTRPSDGTSWDPLGGAPDLFLAQLDGTPLTPFVPDNFSATFAGPLDVSLTASGQEAPIAVFDDDAPASPDGAFICRYPLHGAELRTRTFGCSGALGTLSATLQPR